LGGLWVIPPGGGDTRPLATGERAVHEPRWSPNGEDIVFTSDAGDNPGIRIFDIAAGSTRAVGEDEFANVDADWHPDGGRLVFASERADTGFDIWEADVATGLSWRLTDLPGDEREPAWSADGQNLVFVHRTEEAWRIVLRLKGQPDEILEESELPLAAPSWRPDGSLVTWMRKSPDGWITMMTILSEPRLTRTLIKDEDLFLTPVAWENRQSLVYAAGGKLKRRDFNSWRPRNIPFRANVGRMSGSAGFGVAVRDLPAAPDAPDGRKIIRAARIYDGIGSSYTTGVDIVIDGGRVSAIEDRRERNDGIVVDMGDATVLPGYIDAYATLPEDVSPALGPRLLGLGVTTMVAAHPRSAELDRLWSGPATPGPRILAASDIEEADPDGPAPWLITIGGDLTSGEALRGEVTGWRQRGTAVLAKGWQVALGSGAGMLLGTDTRPASPAGIHYQDVQLASGVGTMIFVSGLADASTPGLASLWRSRAAQAISPPPDTVRPAGDAPDLASAATLLVAGSRPNGLPPGIALHAELRALKASGLRDEQVIRTMGVNAAAALGLAPRAGRIAPGAVADLVFVFGDPLADIDATLNIAGVIRNGRFFSVSGLLDLAAAAENVE
jgi:hypothetical protein